MFFYTNFLESHNPIWGDGCSCTLLTVPLRLIMLTECSLLKNTISIIFLSDDIFISTYVMNLTYFSFFKESVFIVQELC